MQKNSMEFLALKYNMSPVCQGCSKQSIEIYPVEQSVYFNIILDRFKSKFECSFLLKRIKKKTSDKMYRISSVVGIEHDSE